MANLNTGGAETAPLCLRAVRNANFAFVISYIVGFVHMKVEGTSSRGSLDGAGERHLLSVPENRTTATQY